MPLRTDDDRDGADPPRPAARADAFDHFTQEAIRIRAELEAEGAAMATQRRVLTSCILAFTLRSTAGGS